MNLSKDLVAASSVPLVLGILVEGESYGYEIVKKVEALSGGVLNWTDGMMYPLLHRLEQQGLVKSVWRSADTGRRRKYYQITPPGKKNLMAQHAQWSAINTALNTIWRDLDTSFNPA